MKAVFIKVLISLIITYLAIAFVDWDLAWYQRLALLSGADRVLIGTICMLILLLMYCIVNLIEAII